MTRDKESHCIIIKGLIYHDNGKYVHIREPVYIKQILVNLNKEIDNNTIKVGTSLPHFHQCVDHPDRK